MPATGPLSIAPWSLQRRGAWLALAVALSACNGTGPATSSASAEGTRAAVPSVAQSGDQARTDDDLVVSHAWIRAPLPSAGIAGGYLQLHNAGSVDDRLVAIRSNAIERVEIHGMRDEGGVLRMRPFPEGLALPAGGTAELAPGGYHLMLINPGDGVVAGRQINATLVFAHAPAQQILFDVRDSVQEEGEAGAPEDGPEAAEDRAVPEADDAGSMPRPG